MWYDYDRLKAISKVAVLPLVQYCPLPVVVHNHPSGDPTPSPKDLIRADTWVRPYATKEGNEIIGQHRYIRLKEREGPLRVPY